MSLEIVFAQMIVIVILVCVGIGLYKKKYIDETMSEKLSAIVVDVCNPVLCLSCGLEAKGAAGHKEIAFAFMAAFLVYVFLLVSGFFVPKICGISRENQKYYNMMMVYGNIGFIGIPVAKAVLPPESMLYVIILNIVYSVIFYTHGIWLMGAKKEAHFKLQPGLVCSVLTIIIFWFELSFPDIVTQSITYIGNATTFLSMTLLGCSFAAVSAKVFKGNWKTYLFIILKMLVIPVVLGYLLSLLKVNEHMVQAFVLLAAMPAGNMPLMLAKQVGENTEVLTQGILLTTIVTPLSLLLVTLVL